MEDAQAKDMQEKDMKKVTIETSRGTITAGLHDVKAPVTVKNFISY